jgi:hypothetical protein
MIRRRVIAVLLFSLLPALFLSCNSSNNPTNPGGGSGELSGSLPPTGHYVHVFARKGSFNYYCTIHPSCTTLQGTIVVVDSGTVITNKVLAITQSGGSAAGPYGGGSCSSLSVQRDTILVGEQITWTNNSPLAHTVTSH